MTMPVPAYRRSRPEDFSGDPSPASGGGLTQRRRLDAAAARSARGRARRPHSRRAPNEGRRLLGKEPLHGGATSGRRYGQAPVAVKVPLMPQNVPPPPHSKDGLNVPAAVKRVSAVPMGTESVGLPCGSRRTDAVQKSVYTRRRGFGSARATKL